MNRLLWKKKATGGRNKWWLSGGLMPADVIAAYQFSRCLTEDIALTNLNDPETYKLEKRWNTNNPLTKPIWNRKTGFEIVRVEGFGDTSYLFNDDLFATGADSPASQIKAMFVCYSGLDTELNKGTSILSFRYARGNRNIWKTLYGMAIEDDGDNPVVYHKCPGMIIIYDGYDYMFTTGEPKKKGVIGFVESDSKSTFYVDGKEKELTRKGNHPAIRTIGIGNATAAYSIGYFIKAIAVYKTELTVQQALAISSAMRSFL